MSSLRVASTKQPFSLPRGGPGQDADSISMHSNPGAGDAFLDDDAPELQDDDLPPLYDDSQVDASLLQARRNNREPGADGQQPLDDNILVVDPVHKDSNNGIAYYMHPVLDSSPKDLENQVKWWARTPPRLLVRIAGTHHETVDNQGKKERKQVVDFAVTVDLTPYLRGGDSWRELRTVENEEVVRRGTVLRKRAPGAASPGRVELGDAKPTLAEWCHRYCASHAGLKAFVFRRRVTGLDRKRLQDKLGDLVASTGYRGHVDISFPVQDATCVVYNDCRTNRWRLTSWIVWLTMFTLTFVFTWPYLFFRTKRFEVVVADWAFSLFDERGNRVYATVSEEQWYNMWGRAIYKAVLSKRQATLDQQDLLAADQADPSFESPVVGGFAGILRAGAQAMNEVNRHLGWGADS